MTVEEMRKILKAERARDIQPPQTEAPLTVSEMRRKLKGQSSINLSDPGTIANVVKGAKVVEDYLGGNVRTGLAQAVGLNPSAQDVEQAHQGNAKSFGQYMKQGGVGELGKASNLLPGAFSKQPRKGFFNPMNPQFQVNGPADVTGRGVVGGLTDMATNPLNYAGLLKNALSNLGKGGKAAYAALNPAETLLHEGGKKIYKAAPIMKAADAANDRFGKQAASDILFHNKISGTGRGIADKAEVLAKTIGEERNKLLMAASNGTLDMNRAMQPAEAYLKKLRTSRDPNTTIYANALEQKIAEYKALTPRNAQTIPGGTKTVYGDAPGQGTNLAGYPQTSKTIQLPSTHVPGVRGVTPMEGSSMKSSLYNDMGNNVWDTLSKTPQGQLGNKYLARGLDQETSAAVARGTMSPANGALVDDLNNTWGALLTPRKVLESEARKGERKNLFTAVDALALGASHDPGLMALKKSTDLLHTNLLKTKAGRGMHNLSTMHPDAFLREYITKQHDSTQPEQLTDEQWFKLRRGQ